MQAPKIILGWAVLAALAAWLLGCGGFFVNENTTISFPVYVANSGAASVSAFKLNPDTGALSPVTGSPFPSGTGPSALGRNSTGVFLYSANVGNAGSNGGVSGWTINSDGTLTPMGGSPFVAGASYASIAVDPQARFLFAGQASAAGIQAFSVASNGGALTALGGVAGTTGTPLRMAEHPSGKFLYVAEGASGVDVFSISTGGVLANVQNVPLAAANGLAVSSKFAYVADGTNGVDAYSIDSTTGQLTAVGGAVAAGNNPSNVALSPSGAFVFVTNRDSNNVSAYTADATTGALTPVTGSPFGAGTNPVAVSVDPSSRYVYVTNRGAGSVSIFTIGSSPAGKLVSGGVANTGSSPNDVLIAP